MRTVRIGSLGAGGTTEHRSELDSHADTCVVGEDTALVILDHDRPVRVHGYDESSGDYRDCRTVSSVTAYDHPKSGHVYMFVLHQAIMIPTMTNNLISPMQVRDNEILVNDEPKHLVLTPSDNHHAITIVMDGDEEDLIIPLSFQGVTSYFPTRKPTRQEWEASKLEDRIDLTAESPEWDPHDSRLQQQ